MPNLVLFDLDNTLISGDSDYEWGQFICEHGLVDAAIYQKQNQSFYEDYTAGTLDIHAYLRFALKNLSENNIEDLFVWRKQFLQTKIQPLISSTDKNLVAQHKINGDITVIISSTNRFITEPIAQLFKADALIATELEMHNGQYTGNIVGNPCFQAGKITCLQNWLAENKPSYSAIWFYSDSINDLPLLEYVDKPIVKNGDTQLTTIAKQRQWMIL